MKNLTIYTDGSCLGNPGPGGWAAIIIYNNHKKEISGGYQNTTNNRMELMAIIKALGILKESCKIELYTDSQYVCNAINNNWVDNWMKNNWKKRDGKSVLNCDLWISLFEKIKRHNINFNWIRGHNGTPENERCDYLARMEALKDNLPIDIKK